MPSIIRSNLLRLPHKRIQSHPSTVPPFDPSIAIAAQNDIRGTAGSAELDIILKNQKLPFLHQVAGDLKGCAPFVR